ncbi:MAG TPA: transcription antitermination factor NusB [Bacteroidales bacterium]|nr:transcription antitermination factor NusB [Bacteroidales bacterium]
MLSRRFLRIKVLQAIYAYMQEGPESINSGEKQLLKSLDKLYELYIRQLSLLIEISDFAQRRIEENKLKFLPTESDLNPNTRFINNQFISQLAANRDFIKKRDQYKITWADDEEMIRKLYNQLRESTAYTAYMAASETSYKLDKEFVEKIFEEIVAQSELLESYYEERSIYWSDDFEITLYMVQKTIRGFRADHDEYTPLPALLKDENAGEGSEDLDFVKNLYRKTIIHSDEFNGIIAEKAQNWEIDRIALMDMLLLKMAMTEFIDFPSVPVKVTLNEYIELAKSFSTPKSKLFINGILDKLIVDFKADGRLVKTGRGLME